MNIVFYSKEYFTQLFDLVHLNIEEIYKLYYPKNGVNFFHNLYSKENLEADLENCEALLVLKEKILIGTGSFLENKIKRIFVSPNFQGQGIGTQIMKQLENLAKKKGCSEIILKYCPYK